MGSSNQQLYSLSWGEFGSSLTTAVQLLRGQGDLVDVTLAAGGRTFAAHKIVLSAASPFLLDLLKNTPCQHPVVMLAGIDAEDLESLLEFVYRGQVSVDPSQLPSLLQAAHCLSIHGLSPPTILTQNGEEIAAPTLPSTTEKTLITREAMNSSIPPQRRKRRRKSSTSSGKWPRGDHTDNEERNHNSSHGDERTVDYADPNKESEAGSHDDIAGDGSKGRSVSDQPTTCPICGAILRQSRNLRRHLELLHYGSGNGGKSSSSTGVRSSRRNKPESSSSSSSSRLSEFHRQSLSAAVGRLPHSLRIDHPHQLRISENSDFSVPPLSLVSTLSSSGPSNLSLAGNLGVSAASMLNCQDPATSGHTMPSGPTTIPGNCGNTGIYSNESSSANQLLNCLLPNLPSLPSLSSTHDVFRHSEMLRAGMAYHDSHTQPHNTPSRHMQHTDVT